MERRGGRRYLYTKGAPCTSVHDAVMYMSCIIGILPFTCMTVTLQHTSIAQYVPRSFFQNRLPLHAMFSCWNGVIPVAPLAGASSRSPVMLTIDPGLTEAGAEAVGALQRN